MQLFAESNITTVGTLEDHKMSQKEKSKSILHKSEELFSHNHVADDPKITTVTTLKDQQVSPKQKLKKKSKNILDKAEDLFSNYDENFFEDMIVYPFDVMIPDEVIKAAGDVIKHRDKKGYDENDKELPKTVCTDACNFFLTTGYYYMQDVSHITQRIWDESVCKPDRFVYDETKDPKVDLTLKENDVSAGGVTPKGIVLPYNPNFPYAQYPYAKEADGCSAEELEFIYDLSNVFSSDDHGLSKACDAHDECYFTEGTTYKECNDKFIVEAIDACNAITTKQTLITAGSKNAFCNMKSLAVATGANICARKYFREAQKKQKAYNNWVRKYERSYLDAKLK